MDRSRILRSRVVDFLRSTPLLWHIIQREISLRYLIEARTNVAMGRVFLGVDAIYGAGSDAGGVFCSDARFGDDVCQGPPPPVSFTVCLGKVNSTLHC